MDIEEIKRWLNESECDAALRLGIEPPDWPVDKANLMLALHSVGIEEADAEAMFSDLDVSFRILATLTHNYQDCLLVLGSEEASVTPWNNTDASNWCGYAEGGNVYQALILLILCMKCYLDNPAIAWDAGHYFYVNIEWQRAHGIEDW